jgi:hypothetical protein
MKLSNPKHKITIKGANKYPQALNKNEECRLRTQIAMLIRMAASASTTGQILAQILAFSISSSKIFLFGNFGTPPGKVGSRRALNEEVGGKFPWPDDGGGGGRLAIRTPLPLILIAYKCIHRV